MSSLYVFAAYAVIARVAELVMLLASAFLLLWYLVRPYRLP